MKIEELDKLENEEWKLHPIGVYVSNIGRCFVPFKKNGKGNSYTYGYNRDERGYKSITVNKKQYLIHRLIAELFIPNPNDYPTVDHINRNKSDNRVENLRWATHSTQIKNKEHPLNNAQSKQVMQIEPSTNEVIRIWESTRECNRNDFKQSAVSACCNNKFNRIGNNIYKGYKWQYYR